MNDKLLKLLALVLLTINIAFAQADPCKDETQKAENFYDVCVKIDVKSESYTDCIKLFMQQKNKANEACKTAPVAALPSQKNAKPKIAVYLMESKLKPNEVEMIETKISIPFVQSGQYTIVERNDPFLGKLAAEVKKQKDGSLDYSKIRSLGKQADIKFICMANIVEAFGITSISARLIDTESEEIPKMVETEIKNLSEIGQAAAEIYKQINDGKAIAANSAQATVAPPKPALNPERCIGAKCPSAAAFASATMSVAQALKGSSLPGGCVADFTNLLEKDGFNMANFVKELPPAVAKVKLQMKSPFGKPKDGDRTSVGLTVGCIKSLPESPTEIQGLLKDIALKAGLNFAAKAAASAVESDDDDDEYYYESEEFGRDDIKNVFSKNKSKKIGVVVAAIGVAIIAVIIFVAN